MAVAESTSAPVQRAPPSAPAPPTAPVPREEFLGVILARITADIAPRFEGRLREVHVRLGDRVEAGALLAELDAPSLRFDLRVAEASLSAAGVDQARTQVELTEAREKLERRRTLAAEALASREDLSSARYQEQLASKRLDATRAQIDERRAQVDRLRKDNSDTHITAPFAGVVAARYVDPGATVRPSTPILRLVNMDDLFVRFALPEARAATLTVGRSVHVYVGDARLDLPGVIDKIAPEIDAASHLVFMEARLDPIVSKPLLLSGEEARVSLAEAPSR